jgi:signal transduction histidine kinase
MAVPATTDRSLRRDRIAIALGAAALGLLLLGLLAFNMLRDYGQALSAGRLRSANLAHLLDEQTRRSVQAVDLTLLSVVDVLRLHPDTPPYDPAFAATLRSRLSDLPFVRALYVIGADGFIIHDTDTGTPRVSLADRGYFRAHRDNPSSGLHIGPPLFSRSTQIGSPWFLSISRRITLPDGTFYGVAVAALEPRYFTHFYADIGAAEGGSVALIHRSGPVIARYPDSKDAIGKPLANEEPLRGMLAAVPAGTFADRSSIDGVERIVSYRALDPYPLVVTVGVSTATLLRPWGRELRVALAAAGFGIVVLLAATVAFLRMRARETLAAERLRQLEKSEALGRMTSTIAHDFNNILLVVLGNLEWLAEALPRGDRLHGRAVNALAAAERGARLVSQMMSFSRRHSATRTEESLLRLLDDMDDLLRQAASPARLTFDGQEGLWTCELDRSQFERAVMNLVVNARDAMPKGGSIAISAFNLPKAEFDRYSWPELSPGDYVGCRVRDDGEGMPPEVAARACDPFFTTKGEGRGTGLGLSQVHGFARQCGGTLKVESAIDVGTTVTILLPRARRRGSDEPATS